MKTQEWPRRRSHLKTYTLLTLKVSGLITFNHSVLLLSSAQINRITTEEQVEIKYVTSLSIEVLKINTSHY